MSVLRWRHTMKRLSLFFLGVSFLFCGSAVVADESLKSGPQVGQYLPGTFNPLNVTNAEFPRYAGTKNDYIEQHGRNPVVLIFARALSTPLTTLTRKLDVQVVRNRSAKLRAVVVVLSDDEGLEKKLEALAKEDGIKNVSLAVMEPSGPKHYKLSPAADVTVVLYRNSKVEANHAFKKGAFDEKALGAILRDVPRIVPRGEP
jgi:hypothetical protein